MDQNEELNPSPSKVAKIVLDNVIEYCDNDYEGSGTSFDCFVDHNPDQFYEFIDLPLFKPGLSEEELEAIGNPETFWDEVKKEYEKLWKETVIRDIVRFLDNDLIELYVTLYLNHLHISDSCRVKRLKAYEELLNGFKDAIRHALQERRPLTELELRDWYKKMGEAVYGYKNYNYNYYKYFKEVVYDLNFYDMLDDNGKLEVLSKLLNNHIDGILNEIKRTLSELEGLKNER
jgi:hypothetical protein